jgi:hypothetical protein
MLFAARGEAGEVCTQASKEIREPVQKTPFNLEVGPIRLRYQDNP